MQHPPRVVEHGGGSTSGLGKALALRMAIDQVCNPAAYAGTEATPILGKTKDGLKTKVQTSPCCGRS